MLLVEKSRLTLLDGFPETLDIGRTECAVIEAIARHHTRLVNLVPDHTTVIRTNRSVKASLIKCADDLVHIEVAVLGNMACLLEIEIRLVCVVEAGGF